MYGTSFQIRFGGLCIGFSADIPMAVPWEFRPFLTEGEPLTDRFAIEVISSPIVPRGEALYMGRELAAYREEEGTLLVHSFMSGGEVAPGCRLRLSGDHSLYVTKEIAESLEKGAHMAGMINGEELLLRHDALLLHSSVVCHEGKGILFCGPSGIGKSTQADLWQQVYGDRILNGDRAVVRLTEEGVQGGGSPWCGSSGIYSSESVPVAAIVLLRQGEENVITPADPKIAFREIYSQCIVHGWDRHFVDRVCDLIQVLLDRVPVYVLRCLPEAAAVLLTENTVFRRERGYNL